MKTFGLTQMLRMLKAVWLAAKFTLFLLVLVAFAGIATGGHVYSVNGTLAVFKIVWPVVTILFVAATFANKAVK